MATTITARRLIGRIGEIEYPVVTVAEDGTIADVWSDPEALRDETTTLTAAFLDVHTHGGVGQDVMSASAAGFGELQRFLARRGVAAYLPTTVTADVEATLRALERMANEIERTPREGEARPLGVHLEGPFLSHAKRGVHPAAELQMPSVWLFERFREAARGHVRLMTVAPELPGAAEMIAHAVSRGVRVSMGHTNATAAEARAGIAAGAVSATHTFNAMRALDHREPGVLGVVLDEPGLWAELICDGVHVAPEAVRLWWRAKRGAADGNGTDARAILVTDAMAAAGAPDGTYKLGGLPVAVAGGRALLADDLAAGKETLAGSVLTMDRAVENLRRFTEVSLAEAVRAASHTPAAMLGEPGQMALVKGAEASLNRFDAEGQLVGTYLRGRVVERG